MAESGENPWGFELEYECGTPGARLQFLIGVYDAELTRILFLDSQVVNDLPLSFPERGMVRVGLSPAARLQTGRHTVNLALVCNGEMADYVQGAVDFDVAERDFFGTGRHPAGTAPVWVHQHWMMTEAK
jgi:hypothetical protein